MDWKRVNSLLESIKVEVAGPSPEAQKTAKELVRKYGKRRATSQATEIKYGQLKKDPKRDAFWDEVIAAIDGMGDEPTFDYSPGNVGPAADRLIKSQGSVRAATRKAVEYKKSASTRDASKFWDQVLKTLEAM